MPDNINIDLNEALTAYTDIFYLLTFEQKKKHKNEIDKYFACNEIGATSFDDFLIPLSQNESVFCARCPTSEKHIVIKNGKGRDGRQRYICKDCGKTFYAVQDSLSSNVNQDINTWIKFVRGILRQYSLDELSEDCNISRTTALSWRLRVFQALEILLSKVKLYGNIIADDTRLNYNLKGNHNADFIMPRNSRSRGGSYSKKYYNQNSLCILCAVDENGNSFSKVVGFGNPSAERICDGFKDKIDSTRKDNVLITDGAQYFKKAIDTYGFSEWKKQTTLKKGTKRVPNTSSDYHIQSINSYHSRLKRFIRFYNGVSSRYLPGYLLLFDYLQNNKNIDDTTLCREILSTMATASKLSKEELENKYVTPVSNESDKEMWERKVPLSEQKVYRDWVKHMPIKEIIHKHRVKRRKIYAIKEKVEKFGLHDAILNKESFYAQRGRPSRKGNSISDKDWDIFIKYYHQGIRAEEIAMEYNTTHQTVYNIVNAIKSRPEAQSISKYIRSQKPVKAQINCSERNLEIYTEYKFLKAVMKTQKEVVQILATKYGLAKKYVYRIIYAERERDHSTTVKYRWTEERKNLPPKEYYQFLQNRNRAFVIDINTYITQNPRISRAKAFKVIAPQYNISVSFATLIYYYPDKYLYIYDHFLEKNGLTQQAQDSEQEALPRGLPQKCTNPHG